MLSCVYQFSTLPCFHILLADCLCKYLYGYLSCFECVGCEGVCGAKGCVGCVGSEGLCGVVCVCVCVCVCVWGGGGGG